MQNNSQRAFTLIEMLIVIGIIAILVSIIMSSISSSKAKARDDIRKNDLKELATAIELYYDAYGKYPMSNDDINGFYWCTQISNPLNGYGASFSEALKPFINEIPHDPIWPNSNKDYFYWTANGDYYLYAELESSDRTNDDVPNNCFDYNSATTKVNQYDYRFPLYED